MPEDGETVSTPVTDVTETEDGVTVIGYPSDTSTGVATTPTVGADNGVDPRGPEQEGA